MTGSSTLASLQQVNKSFVEIAKPRHRLAAIDALLRGKTIRGHQVLKDINLSFRQGESTAILGPNGAGKSTLLKILCGVMEPTTGSVTRSSSTGALLELGAGFDPDATGVQNLYLSGALLGMDRRAVEASLEDIFAFADIGDAVHQPVKTYSSGMVVRLAFALIAMRRPDLLISDEILAVGDASFQKRCIAWLEDYLATGGTLLLVSHSTYHVQKLCHRAIWLHQGRVEADGDVHDICQRYLSWHERKLNASATDDGGEVDEGSLRLTVTPERLAATAPAALSVLIAHEGSTLSPEACVEVAIERPDGTRLFVSQRPLAGTQDLRLHLELPDLLPSTLRVIARVLAKPSDRHGVLRAGQTVRLLGETRELGCVRLDHHWQAIA